MEKDYTTLAHAIMPFLPQDIIDHHKTILNDKTLCTYLVKKYNYTSLTELLGSCIKNEATDSDTIKSILAKLKTYRRVTKGRWLAPLEEELPGHTKKNSNPMLLTKEAESYIFLSQQNPTIFNEIFTSKEDFIEKKFNEILLWKHDVKAPLISFKYFKTKTSRCQVESYIKDLLLAAFYIIEENFQGSYLGYVTNIPSDFLKYPIFTLIERRPYMEEIAQDLAKKIYYQDYQISDKTIIRTQLENDGYVTKSYELDNKSITYKYPQLNPLDNELLILIYNILVNNFLYLNNNSFSLKIKEIAKIIYPNIKCLEKKHYKKIEEHLLQISRYNFQVLCEDVEDHDSYTKLSINFFNSIRIEGSKSGSSAEISPSEYLGDVIRTNKHISILTQKYQLIDSNQTRTLVAVLQNERISTYLRLEDKSLPLATELPFSFFRSKFRVDRITITRLKQYVINCLEELISKNIIINSYEIKKKGVHIIFEPFDKTELSLYKLSDDNNILLELV